MSTKYSLILSDGKYSHSVSFYEPVDRTEISQASGQAQTLANAILPTVPDGITGKIRVSSNGKKLGVIYRGGRGTDGSQVEFRGSFVGNPPNAAAVIGSAMRWRAKTANKESLMKGSFPPSNILSNTTMRAKYNAAVKRAGEILCQSNFGKEYRDNNTKYPVQLAGIVDSDTFGTDVHVPQDAIGHLYVQLNGSSSPFQVGDRVHLGNKRLKKGLPRSKALGDTTVRRIFAGTDEAGSPVVNIVLAKCDVPLFSCDLVGTIWKVSYTFDKLLSLESLEQVATKAKKRCFLG